MVEEIRNDELRERYERWDLTHYLVRRFLQNLVGTATQARSAEALFEIILFFSSSLTMPQSQSVIMFTSLRHQTLDNYTLLPINILFVIFPLVSANEFKGN